MVDHLTEKWGDNPPCPYCEEWGVGTEFVELRPVGKPSTYIVVPVSCTNCGNTVLVGADEIGIWPDE